MSSSRSGVRRVEGQRLSPLLAAICGPSTLTLEFASAHPEPRLLAALDPVFNALAGSHGRGVAEQSLTVVGAGGAELSARLYTPVGVGADAPLLVFFHGGGWVLGSLVSHASVARFTAREASCKVLAVGYRRAPAARFPTAARDAAAAFRWAAAHVDLLGVDPARIAVGGDSAGGNLAAGVCLQTAGEDVRPCAAWLVYPLVDPDVRGWASGVLYAEGPLLSARCLEIMLGQYAPDASGRGDPLLDVLHAPDLEVLPPTYIATAGMDPLRDQGEAFADALRTAGVETELERFTSMPHGFDLILLDRGARQASRRTCRALAKLLASPSGRSRPEPSRSL